MRPASWGSSGPHDHRTPPHPRRPTNRNVFPFMVLAGARIDQIPPRPLRPAQVPGMPPRRVHGPIPNRPDTTTYRFGLSKIKPAVSATNEHCRLGPCGRSPKRPRDAADHNRLSDIAQFRRCGIRRSGLGETVRVASTPDKRSRTRTVAGQDCLRSQMPRSCTANRATHSDTRTIEPALATCWIASRERRRPQPSAGHDLVPVRRIAGPSSTRTRPFGPSQRPTNAAEPGPSAR